MPRAGAKVVAVLPARDAAAGLERALAAVPRDWVDEVLLVGDGSEATAALARRIPQLHVAWHPHDAGDAGRKRALHLLALERGADVVVSLSPAAGHEPLLVPRLVEPLLEGAADVVLGARRPAPRAERLLARCARTRVHDLRTGLRACTRRALVEVPFLRLGCRAPFDAELALGASRRGLRVHEVPAGVVAAAAAPSARDAVRILRAARR